MFEQILINPRTKKAISNFVSRPSHALLLVGQKGSGKATLAKAVAAKLLDISQDDLKKYPYFAWLTKPEDKQEIPIELVRELTKTLSTKVPGKNPVRQVVVIEDAETMSPPAQNAFLKSLEEPAPGTVFVLTANSKSSLLPTVVSRTTIIPVEPVSLAAASKFFNDKADIKSAWALSQGAAGLLASLLNHEENGLSTAVEAAKDLLAKSRYDRLIELDKMGSRAELIEFLDGLTRVFRALYRAAAQKNDTKRMQKVISAAQLALQAQEDLAANAMPRLVVLNLVLSLPL